MALLRVQRVTGRQIESVHTKSLPHCDGGGRGQQGKFNVNGVTIGALREYRPILRDQTSRRA